MKGWLQTYLPEDLKQGIDYVLVSYYDDDNDGYQPNWQQVFAELETLFSRAKLGIGECGTPSEHAPMARKLQLFRHYYAMPQYTPRYVGGTFGGTGHTMACHTRITHSGRRPRNI